MAEKGIKYTEEAMQKMLRAQSPDVLAYIYTQYRSSFIAFTNKYSIDKEVSLDIFQDSIIDMYQNFALKKVVLKKEVSIKSYLFGIGKNKIYNELKRSKKTQTIDNLDWNITNLGFPEIDLSEYQEKLKRGFSLLGEKCKEVIKLFYYRGFTIQEIVDHLHYKDANTVKSQKSRCIKKLKSLIEK